MKYQSILPLTILSIALGLLSPANAEDAFTKIVKPVFRARCGDCHGNKRKVKGDVNLIKIKSSADLIAQPELLEAIVGAIADREMPPEKKPPLKDDEREAVLKELRASLRTAQASLPFAPTPIRRMNRFQYNNAVMDLLDLTRDIFRLNERFLRSYNDHFKPESGKMPALIRVAVRRHNTYTKIQQKT